MARNLRKVPSLEEEGFIKERKGKEGKKFWITNPRLNGYGLAPVIGA